MDAAELPVAWDPSAAAPSADAARALEDWARARGVRIGVGDDTRGVQAPVDLQIGDRVEADLARARDALNAQDADRVERALASAEATLREHAELPHAHWLEAEVLRLWSQRHARLDPRDLPLAHRLWQDAEAVGGHREPGLGEIAAPRPPERITVELAFEPARDVEVHLDGQPVAGPGNVELAVGPHHVVVRRGGPTWASFVRVESAGQVVRIPVGADSACRKEDLARARREGGRVVATGVACGAWIFAAATDVPQVIHVAMCERSACGGVLEWRARGAALPYVPQNLPRSRPWPAWATWTLIGAGVVTAGAITLVSTGVLESRPTETRFVNGGVDSR